MVKNLNVNVVQKFNAYILISGETIANNYTDYLIKSLDHFGYRYQEVEGYYNNTKEVSYKVKCDLDTDVNQLAMLAYLCHQEAIMLVDGRNCEASLLLIDNDRYQSNIKSRTKIGTWKKIDDAIEKNHVSYSIINGQKYVVDSY